MQKLKWYLWPFMPIACFIGMVGVVIWFIKESFKVGYKHFR